MPKAVQANPEQDYGAKEQGVQNVQNQQAAAAMGTAQWPSLFAEGDEDDSQTGSPVTQTGNVAQGAQQPMAGQQGMTIRNPYMLLPASMNFPDRQATPVERRYRAGLLWDVLAADPNASEMTRMIARSLLETSK
jgi:hypothetical protein